MARILPASRAAAVGAAALGLALAAPALLDVAFARPGSAGPSIQVSRKLDTHLCRFPLGITVRSTVRQVSATVRLIGPSAITLQNRATGRTRLLEAPGSYSTDTTTGSITFQGRRIWWRPGVLVPYLATDGSGRMDAPYLVLTGADSHPRVIDPCALVAASPPSTRPVTTTAPWGLPASALSQIAYAGLIPQLGNLVRHDHVHLDVIVNGHRVTIPGTVGEVEPGGGGPCPPGTLPDGDCTAGHFFVPRVAYSPLHTHTTSGIIHIEADRASTYTLGQFFDEWGVRFDATCIGGYCAGGGKRLRVYVEGKAVSGNPRSVVLTNDQEIAVVFGGPGAFASVPSSYNGGWPGIGCGGAREASCFP